MNWLNNLFNTFPQEREYRLGYEYSNNQDNTSILVDKLDGWDIWKITSESNTWYAAIKQGVDTTLYNAPIKENRICGNGGGIYLSRNQGDYSTAYGFYGDFPYRLSDSAKIGNEIYSSEILNDNSPNTQSYIKQLDHKLASFTVLSTSNQTAFLSGSSSKGTEIKGSVDCTGFLNAYNLLIKLSAL